MIEEELIALWQSSSRKERVKFEKSRLMIELQASLVRLNRWWKYLTWLELSSIGVGMVAFTFISFKIPYQNTKFAAMLLVLLLGYMGYRILAIRKFQPRGMEKSYRDYLEKTRVYLLQQQGLLRSAIYWAVLPIYPILILFFVDFWGLPGKRTIIVATFLAAVIMGIYGFFLNRRRIQREINPRLQRVNQLLSSLSEESNKDT